MKLNKENQKIIFPTHFKVATKYRKLKQFYRKCILENDLFFRKFNIKTTKKNVRKKKIKQLTDKVKLLTPK